MGPAAVSAPRQTAMARGPGPNCPITYTVDPDPTTRSNALAAYYALLKTSGANPMAARAAKAQERWLDRWHDEHNRLIWFYSTLRAGIRDPQYAPKFQEFHRSLAPLRFIRAPNQVGKTYACAAEVWFHATGKHPWRQIDAKWADPRVAKRILIVTGSEKNREGVFDALWALCPIDEVDWVNTHYDKRNKWGKQDPKIIMKHTNVEIIVRSSNQDASSLQSFTVDFVWIDEPPQQETIDEIRRAGGAKHAHIIMSFTPIGEANDDFTWLKHYVQGDPDNGSEPVGQWEQYRIGFDDCPWFSTEEIEYRRSLYREEQIPQRLYGEWEGATTNRRFTHFNEKDHVYGNRLRFTSELIEYEIRGSGNDHGEGEGTQTSIFVSFNKKSGIIDIFEEAVSTTKTASSDDAENMINALGRAKLSVNDIHIWVGDINTGGKESRGEKLNGLLARSLVNLSGKKMQSGIVIPFKYAGSVETEEKRINEAFKLGIIRVNAKCLTLIRALRHYKGNNSKSDKKYKHILDALRYVLQNIFDRYGICMLYSRYGARAGAE